MKATPPVKPAPSVPTVLHVCSEVFPLLKTGGLADVSAALPAALQTLGCDARLILPGFPAIRAGLTDLRQIAEFPPLFGAPAATLWLGRMSNGIACYMIDCPTFYDRPGNPYADAKQQPYADNHARFALLAFIAVRLADAADPAWQPQVLHCHDWHAGLTPAYLRAFEYSNGRKLAASVMTIHNLAYQGVFPRHLFYQLGLPPQYNDVYGVEFYNQISYLKAGLFFADKICTVSPTYAREIMGPEQGCGLDGLLRQRQNDVSGILNGVDPAVWHPKHDPILADWAANYSADDLSGKARCKARLQSACGLTQKPNAPLFALVSRLTEQKGLHLLLQGLPELLRQGGQLVLLGSGEPALEQAFSAAAAAHPESVAVKLGFDEVFAHQAIAGADMILVPSRFEPCGLTQLYGLQYGTLPLVHHVGGLADTVADASLENLDADCATGFVFTQFHQSAFDAAIRRAFALYRRPSDFMQVQQCAMRQDVAWESAARAYLDCYRNISRHNAAPEY